MSVMRLPVLQLLLLCLPCTTAAKVVPAWNLPVHVPGSVVADLADHQLPQWSQGGRVAAAPHGQFVDDILRDTPHALRPPSLVAFHSATRPECAAAFAALRFGERALKELPARERLFVVSYDVDEARSRAW